MIIAYLFFSSYEGWDNPFRPEGEISHDAEELLRLWRLGKLEEQNRKNSQSNNNNEEKPSTANDTHTNGQISNATNKEKSAESLLQQNGGHKNGVAATGGGTVPATFDLKRETIGVQKSQHVTINDGKMADAQDPKKKKTDGCCSLM